MSAAPRSSRSGSELAGALRAAVASATEGVDRLWVLFSGGLDSSLLAFLASASTRVELLTVGTDGSSDLAAAPGVARLLGLPCHEYRIRSEDVARILAADDDGLVRSSEPIRSVRVAIALALERLPPGSVAALGQGADELFYGYAHFRGLSESAARARRRADLRRLVDTEWPWTVRTARDRGLDVRAPYLAPAIIELAESIAPPGASQAPKQALRDAARELGLPEGPTAAPKRAMQYGSGVARLVRGLLRARPEGPGDRAD